MTPSAPADQAPVAAVGGSAAGPRATPRPVRRRFWLLLTAAIFVSLPLYPPAWHAGLRTWLVWQAHHQGGDLSIAAIEGGIFDTTTLYGVRYWQAGSSGDAGGTDVAAGRVDFELAWTIPWLQRPSPTWVRAVAIAGVRGRWILPVGKRPPIRRPGLAKRVAQLVSPFLGLALPGLDGFSARLAPETFRLQVDDLQVARGRYRVRTAGLLMSGSRNDDGQFLAREITVAGPGFSKALVRAHGQTYWKGSRLTFSELGLGPDVSLVSATLDGARLERDRLDWECKLTALGGEVRGQGALDFSHPQLALEVAASFRGTALRPLASALGAADLVDGMVDQGTFTFRGDPENWASAQMWLAAHATDFAWGQRRWEDLDLQAVVVNRRVQVHRLELRQRANRLSLTGECPLPEPAAAPERVREVWRRWREGGFSCQIDAKLEDLRALADLVGPKSPALAGRMSINGQLGARPGARQDIDGYLNVEGSRLLLRGAPLDFLRSTLVFQGGAVRVADLQATHDGDYFTGTGSMQLDGPARFAGELRAQVRAVAAYTPALAGLPLGGDLARVENLHARLQWNDSVLHFDQFQGDLDRGPFTVGGMLDLRAVAHPVMDLTVEAKNVPLPEMGGPGRVRADGALMVHGGLDGAGSLAGSICLVGGEWGGSLALEQSDVDEPPAFLPLDRWLPTGWDLDVAITATAAIGLPGGGTLTPALHLRKEGPSTSISGWIDLREVPLASTDGAYLVRTGTLYYDGSSEPFPAATLSLADPQGQELAADGSADRIRWPIGRPRPATVDGTAAPRLLLPVILPPLWVADATPAARWPTWPGASREYRLVWR